MIYNIFPEDVINLMSNAYICMDEDSPITDGQGIRMRETIVDDTDLTVTLTSVDALYEPYSGEYFIDQQNQLLYKPLFQPGFDYNFLECECNPDPCLAPSPYQDTSFWYTNSNIISSISKEETDFSIITHPNGSAIQIVQLQNNLLMGQNTRRCYDNPNFRAKDGLVAKFNDGVINTNVTLIPQDSTSINDINLVNDLEPGLYKIDKNYHNGTQQQDIILKENN